MSLVIDVEFVFCVLVIVVGIGVVFWCLVTDSWFGIWYMG